MNRTHHKNASWLAVAAIVASSALTSSISISSLKMCEFGSDHEISQAYLSEAKESCTHRVYLVARSQARSRLALAKDVGDTFVINAVALWKLSFALLVVACLLAVFLPRKPWLVSLIAVVVSGSHGASLILGFIPYYCSDVSGRGGLSLQEQIFSEVLWLYLAGFVLIIVCSIIAGRRHPFS